MLDVSQIQVYTAAWDIRELDIYKITTELALIAYEIWMLFVRYEAIKHWPLVTKVPSTVIATKNQL